MTLIVQHHHHNREGQLIDNHQWQTLLAQTDYCVLAQYDRATESISAVWHGEGDRYDFAVQILGGKHHGVTIQCSTQLSVLWCFDLVRKARITDLNWIWLAPVEELERLVHR